MQADLDGEAERQARLRRIAAVNAAMRAQHGSHCTVLPLTPTEAREAETLLRQQPAVTAAPPPVADHDPQAQLATRLRLSAAEHAVLRGTYGSVCGLRLNVSAYRRMEAQSRLKRALLIVDPEEARAYLTAALRRVAHSFLRCARAAHCSASPHAAQGSASGGCPAPPAAPSKRGPRQAPAGAPTPAG